MPASSHATDHLVVAGFPLPKDPPVRPLHAMISVLKLVLNKEDTRQVFEVVQAMSGGSGRRLFERFVATEYGRRVVTGDADALKVLSDRARLRSMPEGSLGRAYLNFMESEGLTPEGIIDTAEEAGSPRTRGDQFVALSRMHAHLDVVHDLWHVLTGYGRDALGEVCNLAFTYQQTRNEGLPLIISVGRIAQMLERPDLPISKTIAQAKSMGRNAAWVMARDIEALLPTPLNEVRRELGITEPTEYFAISDADKRALLKPKLKKTQAEREGRLQAAA